MRTTIDIPDALYKQSKIKAIEQGSTLKDFILRALQHELSAEPTTVMERKPTYWANRQLLPEYKTALDEGAFSGGTDSSKILSEDRDLR